MSDILCVNVSGKSFGRHKLLGQAFSFALLVGLWIPRTH